MKKANCSRKCHNSYFFALNTTFRAPQSNVLEGDDASFHKPIHIFYVYRELSRAMTPALYIRLLYKEIHQNPKGKATENISKEKKIIFLTK